MNGRPATQPALRGDENALQTAAFRCDRSDNAHVPNADCCQPMRRDLHPRLNNLCPQNELKGCAMLKNFIKGLLPVGEVEPVGLAIGFALLLGEVAIACGLLWSFPEPTRYTTLASIAHYLGWLLLATAIPTYLSLVAAFVIDRFRRGTRPSSTSGKDEPASKRENVWTDRMAALMPGLATRWRTGNPHFKNLIVRCVKAYPIFVISYVLGWFFSDQAPLNTVAGIGDALSDVLFILGMVLYIIFGCTAVMARFRELNSRSRMTSRQ